MCKVLNRIFITLLLVASLARAQTPTLQTQGVSVTSSEQRTSLNRATGKLASRVRVTIKNNGDRPLEPPLHATIRFAPAEAGLILDGLTLAGAQGGLGQAPYNTFYLDLSTSIGTGLAVNAETSFPFTFERPSTTRVSYSVEVYAVRNNDPHAVIGGPYTGQQGVAIAFDASASNDPDGEALTFAWDFGDGSAIVAGAVANHTFSAPGLYTTTLTVTDVRGAQVFRQTTVPVSPAGNFGLARSRTLDGVGHPLGGVSIVQTGPDGEKTLKSDAVSGFTSLGGEPGAHVWRFEKTGYLTVHRRAELQLGQVRVVPFPWLSALNPNRVTLSLLNPTSAKSPSEKVTLMVPAEAFEQVESVVVTDLHGQSLPLALPFGWSPLIAFHADLPMEGLEDVTALLKLPQPLTSAQTLAWVHLDASSTTWITRRVLSGNGTDLISTALRQPGSYALVIADVLPTGNPVVAVAGEALAAGEGPQVAVTVTADGSVNPGRAIASLDPAKVTATATVNFRNGTQPLASGAWFLAEVEETYDLLDGRALKTPDYDATFYAYQFPGDSDPVTVSAAFPLRPRVLFGPDELSEAKLKVDVLALSSRGSGVITEGGGVLSLEGLQINVPADAVASASTVEIRELPTTGLTRFLGGLTALRAFDLNLPPLAQGSALEFVLRQKLAPSAFFVLARCVSRGADSGLQPVKRLASDVQGNVISIEPANGGRLAGITGSGQYVLIQIEQAEGLITGTVRNVGGALLSEALVRVVEEPWLSVTTVTGTFATLGKPGARLVLATDPADGNNGEATATLANVAAHAVVEIQTAPTGPRIISTTPTNGQQKVTASTPIIVRFSEALDRNSFGPNALTVTNPLGVQVLGNLTLNNAGTEANFLPTNPLEHAATYTVELVTTIKDRQGLEIEGNRAFSFAVIPFFERAAGAQLVIYEPGADNVPGSVRSQLVGYSSAAGSSHVVAHGSAGTADPEVPVILVNQDTGATATVLSKPDGSFANFIDAAEEDFIEAVFVNLNGTRITVPATRQIYDNGRIGLYKYGGILEAESDGGPVQMLIEPGAISNRSVFKLDLVTVNQLAELTGGVLPEGEAQALPGIKMSVEGDQPQGGTELSIPLDPATLGLDPSVAPEDAAFALTIPVEVEGTVVFVTVDKMRYENGRLFTNTCPFQGAYNPQFADDVINLTGNIPGLGGLQFLTQVATPILAHRGYGATVINGAVVQLPVQDVETITRLNLARLASAVISVGSSSVAKTAKFLKTLKDVTKLTRIATGAAAAGDLAGLAITLYEDLRVSGAPAVQGALVFIDHESLKWDGKIRPGVVCAVSDQNGCYSLNSPSLGGVLVATHPRLGRSADVPLGILGVELGVLDVGIKGFLLRNILFPTLDDTFNNLTPRVNVNHSPLLPATGAPAVIQVDAFAAVGAEIAIELPRDQITVDTAVLGQAVSVADLTVTDGLMELVAPGHMRRHFTVTSEKALFAKFVFTAVASVEDRLIRAPAVAYSVAFGFARPVTPNPLAPADPGDREGPKVIRVTPREREFVSVGDAIRIQFNEPIDRGSLTAPNVVNVSTGDIPALSLSNDQQTLTVHPRVLSTKGTFNLTLGDGIQDLSGNSLRPSQTFHFQLTGPVVHSLPGVVFGGGSVMDESVLYVLERGGKAGLRVYDASNPQLPLVIGFVEAGGFSSALDFPRDAVLIKNWAHVPGLSGLTELPLMNRTLLAVVGGLTGSAQIDEFGNATDNGQYLTVLDVSNPRAITRVVNVQLTLRPATVPKVKWEAPFLTYLESSADSHFIGIIDLQELLIGFSVPIGERATVFATGIEGNDLDRNGSYEKHKGETVPRPSINNLNQFMGLKAAFDARPFPQQRIEDFDGSGRRNLAVVRTVSGITPPVSPIASAEFRILVANGQELPLEAGVVKFGANARPKRLALMEQVRLEDGSLRNLAFVSLAPSADGLQKIAVVDWTNTTAPEVLVEIAIPEQLGLGFLQSPVVGSDGLVRVSTTSGQIVLNPALVLRAATGAGLHPAILAVLPVGGSANFTLGENSGGVRSLSLGGRNELIQSPPELSFVHFPTLGTVPDPSLLRGDPGQRQQALSAMRQTSSLRPARFKKATGVPSALSPASPVFHYFVMVRAPGGAGPIIQLLVESLNEAGSPMSSKGKDYPPVRATVSAGDFNPGGTTVAGVDAPVPPLNAYRLSDDLNDPGYNLYLSDPIVMLRERISLNELAALRSELRRVMLWSESAVRASLDVSTFDGPLGPFAADFDRFEGVYRPRVVTFATTLPGGYLPGSTPPPVGGALAVPGTFGTIDAASGEFRHTTADIELPSRRMAIVFERTATSHALVSSGFGRGWDFNYNQRAIELKPELVPPGQREPVIDRGDEEKSTVAVSKDIIFSDGAGNAILFKNKGRTAPAGVSNDPLVQQLGWLAAGGEFYLPDAAQKGVFDLMYRYPSGELVRLTPDGTQFRYRSDGKLEKVEDRYVKNHHLLEYNRQGDLVLIRDKSVTEERSLHIGYYRRNSGVGDSTSALDVVAKKEVEEGKICSLLDFAGRRIDFEYDDAGMLFRRLGVEVTGENGGFSGRPKTTYQINPVTKAYVGVIAGTGAHGGGGDNASTPLAVAGTSPNAKGESVATSVKGAGGEVAINVPAGRAATNVSAGSTLAGHADGSSTAMTFDANGYPAGITMTGLLAGTATYQTLHNERGLPETITYPEGNEVTYFYEPESAPFRSKANVIKMVRDPGPRGGPELTSEAKYDRRYNLPAGEQKDFNGNSITINLHGDGRDVSTVVYPKAGTHTMTFNDFGEMLTETTVEGITTSIGYVSSTGYVDKKTMGGTLDTGFGYNGSIAAKLGLPTTVNPPRGAAVGLVYDDRLQRKRMTRGVQDEHTEYDENGNVVFLSRALGDGAAYEETREYSQINFLNKLTVRGVESVGGNANLVTTFTPDPLFRVKEITLPGGEVRKLTNDHLGNVTQMELGTYREEYGRDLHGNLSTLKKGGDLVQAVIHDGHDRPIEIQNKTGTGADELTTLTYFGKGELKTQTVSGPVGEVVSETEVVDVDELGRPLKKSAKGNQVNADVTMDYKGSGGRVVKATGPVDTFTSTHDAAGRPITQVDSLRTVTLTPDGNGNVTRVVSAEDGNNYQVDMVYNNLDHLVKTSDSEGTLLEATSLRSDGLPLVVKDGRENSITKSYSRLGELLRLDKPEQLRFAYAFNTNRQPVSVKDRSNQGNSTLFDDGTLRPTHTTWRFGSSTSFNAPDGRNLPTSITIPGGSMTVSYDLQGRATALNTTYAGGPYKLENAQYDALGRMRNASYGGTGQHSLTMGYDKLGPLTSCTYNEPGGPFPISSTIRGDGARLTLVYPSGVTVTETRQTSGRLQKVDVGGVPLWEATAYAGADQVATTRRGANITENCLYDGRRRLLSRRFTGPSNALLEDMRFKYDKADNVVARQFIVGGGRADAFGYDAANRLTRADYGLRPAFQGSQRNGAASLQSVEGFAPGFHARTHGYDGGGLDLLQGGVVINPDGLPAQTSAASAISVPHFAAAIGAHDSSFLFPQTVDGFSRGTPDALGNTARSQLLVRPTTGLPTLVPSNLTYNAHSNLIRVQREDGVTIDCQYRPDKLLHHRKVTGGTTAGERALVWHEGRLLEEYDLVPTKVLVARYYYANDDPPVAADLRRPDGSMIRVHYFWDQVLSVVAVANEAGQVIERVRYDAWGQPVITAQDLAVPRIAEVRRSGDDLLVVMSEPVLPPLVVTAGNELQPNNGNTPAQAFRLLIDGAEQTPTVVFEENAPGLPFGSVFRLTPLSSLSGSVTVRVLNGGLVDDWGNATQTEDLSFTFTAGPLLASGTVGVGATSPAAVPRSQIGNSWLWQGQWFDYEAGLVYMRARHYDPVTGQFLQRDPMQYEDSVNLYAGMGNNSVSFRDPTGRGRDLGGAFEAAKTVVTSVARKGLRAVGGVEEAVDDVFASSKRGAAFQGADDISKEGLAVFNKGVAEVLAKRAQGVPGDVRSVKRMDVISIEHDALKRLERLHEQINELVAAGKVRIILDSAEVAGTTGKSRKGFHRVVGGVVSEVHVRPGLSPEKQFSNLVHELTHALNFQGLERRPNGGLGVLFEEFDAHFIQFGIESFMVSAGGSRSVFTRGDALQRNGFEAILHQIQGASDYKAKGVTKELIDSNRDLIRQSVGLGGGP